MKRLYFILSIFLFSACAELQTVMTQFPMETSQPLTQREVASGLKEALRIGSENAANLLSTPNGFLKDEMVKILLPPEAQTIAKNIKMIPGGTKLVEDVELRLNRAAEDAVKEAAPIFASAIQEMTIADAFGILRGGNTSATSYLKEKTSSRLKALFQPKVKASLDKKLIANLSTNESWNILTGRYNKVAKSIAGQMAGLTPVETKLDAYVTQKALNGLFRKVAIEEQKIRKDPMARVTDLLKRVFG
ncbi:MAG: DUF4197 domain-containing protein [Marinifilaceae bacterium]